ncbi:predicted protein [Sclerotinia sclerotiorum 1980 UF-70]|uniref:Uncharacterized protein n=1 Tax=Sclerotinia sclerotiorum (strain ATCC 18683 / 1980 / Ss-1) TaxID=665079 RepID=A7F7P3_SCLS1|nr:predicted protein [Sclerotinia sclerotiorum 1980 UF-70]EDN98764.1 predicted protein [Sclerotinia sclerotiorum 1980 UF-70]
MSLDNFECSYLPLLRILTTIKCRGTEHDQTYDFKGLTADKAHSLEVLSHWSQVASFLDIKFLIEDHALIDFDSCNAHMANGLQILSRCLNLQTFASILLDRWSELLLELNKFLINCKTTSRPRFACRVKSSQLSFSTRIRNSKSQTRNSMSLTQLNAPPVYFMNGS